MFKHHLLTQDVKKLHMLFVRYTASQSGVLTILVTGLVYF
jgi:hypothetical protein